MAEKKKPFEDEFSTDEFDAFDNDDFNFDDEDDDPFQLDISESDTDNLEEESPYQFSEDEIDESDEEGLESQEGERSQQQDKFNPTVMFQNLLERLKNEEPKQLIKYGIGAFIVLLFLIGGFIKLISPSPKAAKTTTTTTTRTNSRLNQPNNLQDNQNIPTLSQNSKPPAGFTSTNDLNGSMPNTPSSSNSLESLNNPTPVAPVPQPSTSTTPAAVQSVVNPAEMQQAATQNSTLTNHISQLDAQVAQLTQQVTIDAQMNASNQAQIASLIKSIDSMQSQMAKVNNAMQTIVSAVGQASNRQSGFVAGGNNFNNNSTPIQTAPDYYVQAVIPGRAWLKSSNGQIITVTRGDAVPGYGTVDTIDSQSGIVTTSTGTKIMFGIDEG